MGSRRHAAMVIAAAALLAVPAPAAGAPPVWETDVGAPVAALSDTDDSATTVALGTFSFPFFGTTYTGADVLTISSNGYVMPGPHAPIATDNTPTGGEMTTVAGPRIAPYWSDLRTRNGPSEQGEIRLNTFADDDADPAVDRLVVTWLANAFGCPGPAAYPACAADFQVQLHETGEIVFGYDRLYADLLNQALAGVSAGSLPADANPGSTDLAATGFPVEFGSVGYQLFASKPLQTGLAGRNLVFSPVSTTGFEVDHRGEDLAVALSATPTVGAGGRVAYSAVVKNHGDAPATGVTLSDRLPPGTALASAPGCKGTDTLTCALGTLVPGASKTLAFELTASTPGTLVNTVTVSPAEVSDPAADNAASASTTVIAPAIDTGPGPAFPLPPAVEIEVRPVRHGLARVVRNRELRVRVTCSAECSASTVARVNRRTARRLGRRSRTLGRAFGGRERAGTVTLAIPLRRGTVRRLREMRSLRATLITELTTADSERVVTSTITSRR
jgi:uncharacterized repeat protein (TIGR01451 family)